MLHAGLLATQSGSLGRLVGNFSISVFGSLTSDTVSLVNVMYLSFAAFVALCLVMCAANFRALKDK